MVREGYRQGERPSNAERRNRRRLQQISEVQKIVASAWSHEFSLRNNRALINYLRGRVNTNWWEYCAAVQRFRGRELAIALNDAGKIAHNVGAYSTEVGRQRKATGAS